MFQWTLFCPEGELACENCGQSLWKRDYETTTFPFIPYKRQLNYTLNIPEELNSATSIFRASCWRPSTVRRLVCLAVGLLSALRDDSKRLVENLPLFVLRKLICCLKPREESS